MRKKSNRKPKNQTSLKPHVSYGVLYHGSPRKGLRWITPSSSYMEDEMAPPLLCFMAGSELVWATSNFQRVVGAAVSSLRAGQRVKAISVYVVSRSSFRKEVDGYASPKKARVLKEYRVTSPWGRWEFDHVTEKYVIL